MGKDLFDNFKIAKETFEEASEAVKKDLTKLCLEGPESELVLTENTQPCLLVASVAAFRVMEKETGFKPAMVAGHSLGEYSALVAADALPLSTAARWVRERGRAMQIAVPAGQGTMAAVMGLDDAKVALLCEKATAAAKEKRAAGSEYSVEAIVEPANYNAPGQIVIAGSTDAVAEAIALIKAGGDFAGGKAIPLSVSAPFHCRLMRPARDRMAELFAGASPENQPKTPVCPYIPNRTGRMTREPGVIFELLVEQVDHPVLWKQSMTHLIDLGYTVGIEFGPGKVLAGLAKRIAQGSGATFTVHPMSDSAQLKALGALLMTPTSSPIAFVTGASRGIGAAIASQLASQGMHVMINYTSNEQKAQQLRASIQASGGKADLCQFDVSKSSEVDEKFEWIAKTFGPVAVLVNNAGITVDSLLIRMKDEDLDRTLNIDLKGAIYCSRAAAKQMMRARQGSIIQIFGHRRKRQCRPKRLCRRESRPDWL